MTEKPKNFPPPQNFIAQLAWRQDLSPGYKAFRFELREPYKIINRAGQYVSILVPHSEVENNEEKHDDSSLSQNATVRRSYSMTDRPDVDSSFEICVSQAHGGLGVNYLNSLELGEKIEVLGPLGMFFVSPDKTESEKNLLFIATGAGIAPMKAMLAQLLQIEGDQRPITLYWGMRNENDYFWLEDFQGLERAFPNFHLKLIVSRPGSEWTLSRGRVTDLLIDDGLEPETGVYICGNPAMVESVIDLLQNNFHHEMSLVHREQFE